MVKPSVSVVYFGSVGVEGSAVTGWAVILMLVVSSSPAVFVCVVAECAGVAVAETGIVVALVLLIDADGSVASSDAGRPFVVLITP